MALQKGALTPEGGNGLPSAIATGLMAGFLGITGFIIGSAVSNIPGVKEIIVNTLHLPQLALPILTSVVGGIIGGIFANS